MTATLTVAEAAQALGVNPATIYRQVKAGDLYAIRLGRRVVIPRWVVDQLLTGHTINEVAS